MKDFNPMIFGKCYWKLSIKKCYAFIVFRYKKVIIPFLLFHGSDCLSLSVIYIVFISISMAVLFDAYAKNNKKTYIN